MGVIQLPHLLHCETIRMQEWLDSPLVSVLYRNIDSVHWSKETSWFANYLSRNFSSPWTKHTKAVIADRWALTKKTLEPPFHNWFESDKWIIISLFIWKRILRTVSSNDTPTATHETTTQYDMFVIALRDVHRRSMLVQSVEANSLTVPAHSARRIWKLLHVFLSSGFPHKVDYSTSCTWYPGRRWQSGEHIRPIRFGISKPMRIPLHSANWLTFILLLLFLL